MSTGRQGIWSLSASALLAALLWPPMAVAHEYRVGRLRIEHPWVRSPGEGRGAADLFLVVYNEGDSPDRLVAVKSPNVGTVELHEAPQSAVVADYIYLPVSARVALAPGGSYARLVDIKKLNPVGWGAEFTLVFQKAGEVVVDASVEAPDATHAHDAEATQRWEKARAGASEPAPAESEPHPHIEKDISDPPQP